MVSSRMKLRELPGNVKALGAVSFFTDIASEMIYPIIPLFVTGTLGLSPAVLGVLEGIAEGTASGLKWLGGRLSDRSGVRKPFVVAGYSLSALSKPLMGLAAFVTVAGGPLAVLLSGRVSDRIGKSIRTAPRDALIAESVAPDQRGSAFGFHRAADTCGAVVGPLCALGVMLARPDVPLAWIFLAAVVPGICSVLIAAKFVREVPFTPVSAKQAERAKGYPRQFYMLAAAFAIFSLGNSSDTFLLLRSRELGLSMTQVVLVYASYNLVSALAAWPLGILSDRVGRVKLIVAGWLVYAAVYATFGFHESPLIIWISMCAYGVYAALTDGVMKAMVSDLVPSDSRGSALGLIASIGGICQVIASVVTGLIWDRIHLEGHLSLALFLGAGLAALAAAVLVAGTLSGAKRVTAAV